MFACFPYELAGPKILCHVSFVLSELDGQLKEQQLSSQGLL